ncbi:MAG: ATP-dependent chaperone ClpB, partial [Propionibacterium sp.]|nr:ATP-dependent chaperone ClpB [Propionibacterium sp.]
MNTDKLTTKSRDAVTAAVRQALTNGNPSTEPAHLLHGLLLTPDNTVGALLEECGASPQQVEAGAIAAIKKLPSATGSSVTQPTLSGPFVRVLATAETIAGKLGDQFAATEHLLIALATVDSDAKKVLAAEGVDAEQLTATFNASRGG